ncbi:addiction module toxin, RelE/StbE family [compost metagenome]
MRMIELASQFRRDYKRELKGPYRSALQGQKSELSATIELLARDQALPARCRDHGLVGALRDCRDCHVRPDLLLIYRKPDAVTLQLIRLGSHSELGF